MRTLKQSLFTPFLWGSSIALSWTWGLGLFFAVQFTFQFGLTGLLSFAIPNAIGLFLFGWGTQRIAKKNKRDGNLEFLFSKHGKKFNSIFIFYQIIALSLTLFAISKYFFQALDLPNTALLLVLVTFLLITFTTLLGDSSNIVRIKYIHAFGMLLLVGFAASIWSLKSTAQSLPVPTLSAPKISFFGYLIPVCIGFLTGPWMDLQQWQRAIQIRKEGFSITKSYFIGSLLFFCILLFHGHLTLWAMDHGAALFAREGIDGIYYGQDILTRFFSTSNNLFSTPLEWSYAGFLLISIFSTLDSGYIALKWHLQNSNAQKDHFLMSLIPSKVLNSPIPILILCGILSLLALGANLELEYFMVFYATYFVTYALLLYVSLNRNTDLKYSRTTLFSVSGISLAIAGIGYFNVSSSLLIFGSLLPLLYFSFILFNSQTDKVASNLVIEGPIKEEKGEAPTEFFPEMPPVSTIPTAASAAMGSEYIEDNWYVHSFRATYSDTNSVGNVYFGMYAMWVGKTRELFFNYCMPDFSLNKTPFLILTRSFDHKFILEAKEFDFIKVKIRIKDFNRKFATLEHQILNQKNQLMGKGKQTLLFVSTKDYKPLDIPAEVVSSFTRFI